MQKTRVKRRLRKVNIFLRKFLRALYNSIKHARLAQARVHMHRFDQDYARWYLSQSKDNFDFEKREKELMYKRLL